MAEGSPKIISISWGSITPANDLPTGKDYKLYPGGGRHWDWNETGTRHKPGIQTADVSELVERGATVVVLSLGMDQVLQVAPGTVEWLESQGVTVHSLETRQAAELYNRMAEEGKAVGGLFHSTC